MTTITADNILIELIKLDRDKRNPMFGTGCVYTDEHGNHCIAGQILANLGAPLPDVEAAENNDGIEELLGFVAGHSAHYNGLDFTEGAVTILQRAQTLADSAEGSPSLDAPRRLWGEVIDYVTDFYSPE